MITLIESIANFWRNYFNLRGRISIGKFWINQILLVIAFYIIKSITASRALQIIRNLSKHIETASFSQSNLRSINNFIISDLHNFISVSIIAAIACLILFIPTITMDTRRFHDANISGLFLLLLVAIPAITSLWPIFSAIKTFHLPVSKMTVLILIVTILLLMLVASTIICMPITSFSMLFIEGVYIFEHFQTAVMIAKTFPAFTMINIVLCSCALLALAITLLPAHNPNKYSTAIFNNDMYV